MFNVLMDWDILVLVGVVIEYMILLISCCVDFILMGKDVECKDIVIIVELKQWFEVEVMDKDVIV